MVVGEVTEGEISVQDRVMEAEVTEVILASHWIESRMRR